MPVTTLDPKTALIVVDLQKGIVSKRAADVVQRATELCEAFRKHGKPVVLVNVVAAAPGRKEAGGASRDRGEDWTEFVPELNRQPGDHVVTKRTWGAFTGTDLERYLRDQGVTQVVVSGIATSAGVESTMRNAHELGFNVTAATDAMMDGSAEAHENSLTRIFPKISETGTTAEIIALLETVA